MEHMLQVCVLVLLRFGWIANELCLSCQRSDGCCQDGFQDDLSSRQCKAIGFM